MDPDENDARTIRDRYPDAWLWPFNPLWIGVPLFLASAALVAWSLT